MDHFGEQPKFEIQSVIEQKPFENPAVQSFFTKWCEINDSIQPQMVDRDEWEKRGIKGVLEKRPDGKQTLFIPEDLQLWEMIGVMEVVDHDTFATKPERRTGAKEKLLSLGKTFQNAGTYIAQRIEGIHQGREIAEALAQEFYEYGQSLAEGKRPEAPLGIDDIASLNITPEQTEIVDRFLAGDTLYESRQKRVEQAIALDPSKKDELSENERQRTLAQFFRVVDKAFLLENKSGYGKLWKSQTPLHNAFLTKIEKAMTQKIETPKREFNMAIFRRGLEKLTGGMKELGWKHATNSFFESLGWDLRVEQKKLVDALHIPKLKAELETTRQTGDLANISQKEREIADKIQNSVSNFPYQSGANNPAEMVANQYINCVGASTLGGALMKEAGLNYLVGSVPEHSILFLVTDEGKIEWRDMLDAFFNEELTDEMIDGRKKDGTPLTIKDIAAFNQKPTPEGLMFDVTSDSYKKKLSWIKEGQRQYVKVFEPEYGQMIQVLNNTGNALSDLGRHEEAIEAYRQAVVIDSKFAYPYIGLGEALQSLGRYKEAVEVYRQAVAIDPKDANPYNDMGNALRSLGHKKEAVEAYRQAIAINPKEVHPYNGLGNALSDLGRKEEAIAAYRKAVAIDPKYASPYNGLGVALSDLGRKEEAIAAYRQAVTIDPKYAPPYNGLGVALSDLGRKEEAIAAYRQFIGLADKKEYYYFIKRAERIITGLQE